MTDEEKPVSSREHLKTTIKTLMPVMKFVGLFSPKIRDSVKKLDSELADFEAIEKNIVTFGRDFGPKGWVVYDNISTELIQSVLNSNAQDAEDLLCDYFIEEHYISRLGYVFHRPEFVAWREICERAHEHAMSEDYISAIPLMTMITDGICQRYLNMSPYSGATSKSVFDTITSAPNGLADAFLVHGASRMKKMQTEPIEIPFRNGILHGNDTNYGHRVVCAKSVNLLAATLDYVRAFQDEDERIESALEERTIPKLSETFSKLKSTADQKAAINAWIPRPTREAEFLAKSNEDITLEVGSPEYAAAQILQYIVKGNYGKIAAKTVNFNKKSIGELAGSARKDLEGVKISDWEVTGVEDTASACSWVDVLVTGEIDSNETTHEFRMRMVYETEDRQTVARNLGGGVWRVMPSFITDLWRLTLPQ